MGCSESSQTPHSNEEVSNDLQSGLQQVMTELHLAQRKLNEVSQDIDRRLAIKFRENGMQMEAMRINLEKSLLSQKSDQKIYESFQARKQDLEQIQIFLNSILISQKKSQETIENAIIASEMRMQEKVNEIMKTVNENSEKFEQELLAKETKMRNVMRRMHDRCNEIERNLLAVKKTQLNYIKNYSTDVEARVDVLEASVEKAVTVLLPQMSELLTDSTPMKEDINQNGTTELPVKTSKQTLNNEMESLSEDYLKMENSEKLADIHKMEKILRYTIIKGKINQVRELLKCGVDVNSCASDGTTALHLAAASGHSRIIWLLLEAGAEVHRSDKVYGWTALHSAAANGKVGSACLLIDSGANIEVQDQYGSTALHVAAKYGHNKMVQALVEMGANIQAKDTVGQLPVDLAFNDETRQLLNHFSKNPPVNQSPPEHVKDEDFGNDTSKLLDTRVFRNRHGTIRQTKTSKIRVSTHSKSFLEKQQNKSVK